MAISRANLTSGPGKITWDSQTFFSRGDITVRTEHGWSDLQSSVHGVIDKVSTDRIFKVQAQLWGAWENLTVLFPAAVLTPTIGSGLFGTSDKELVILGKNGDKLTLHNAQLTKLHSLFLGVNEPIFSANLEWTALIANNTAPTAAAAYYTFATGQAYADTSFVKTNFKQQAYTAVWSGKTGFTSFESQTGWNIEWDMGLSPRRVDSLGTVDMILTNFAAKARCIPVGTLTVANLQTAALEQNAAGATIGRLASAGGADLAISGASGVVVTLKAAAITGYGMAYGNDPLRIGEVTWESTTGITAGTAAARATVT